MTVHRKWRKKTFASKTGTKDAEKHEDFVLHLLKVTVKEYFNFINTTQDNTP